MDRRHYQLPTETKGAAAITIYRMLLAGYQVEVQRFDGENWWVVGLFDVDTLNQAEQERDKWFEEYKSALEIARETADRAWKHHDALLDKCSRFGVSTKDQIEIRHAFTAAREADKVWSELLEKK